jgi:hypothetical protein
MIGLRALRPDSAAGAVGFAQAGDKDKAQRWVADVEN